MFLLEQLRAIPPERLAERPAHEQWSAAELLNHIVKVESGILETVRQKLSLQDRDPVKLGDRFGSLVVRNVMRSSLRIKVPPEVSSVLPDKDATVEAAAAGWERVRQQWRELLDRARGEDLKGGVFSHPKGGWFTLPETVLFVRLHHDHHLAQIRRLQKAFAA